MTSARRIYLDHAAATPLDDAVLCAMEPYWREHYGNAGALHAEGQRASRAIEEARVRCAALMGCSPDEVTFTSGGTEANNLAIFGLIEAYRHYGYAYEDMHAVTSTIEHSSVLDCFRELEKRGVAVTYLGVDARGVINPDEVRRALRDNTLLVSLMYVNSEIGTITPLREIARVLRAHRRHSEGSLAWFHTDASQAPAYVRCNAHALGVDLMSLDAQKMYGPKGVGCLYRRSEVSLQSILYGGDQERGLRPGTPPTPLIVGLAEAFSLVDARRDEEVARLAPLRDQFIEEVLACVHGAELNGDQQSRIAGNVNISVPGIESEFVILQLDARGIAISTKSACRGQRDGSHVVRALGKGEAHARCALRMTLGRATTRDDLHYVAQTLAEIISRDRAADTIPASSAQRAHS